MVLRNLMSVCMIRTGLKTPAERAGLQVGMRIVSVNGVGEWALLVDACPFETVC